MYEIIEAGRLLADTDRTADIEMSAVIEAYTNCKGTHKSERVALAFFMGHLGPALQKSAELFCWTR